MERTSTQQIVPGIFYQEELIYHSNKLKEILGEISKR
jgi:hypothetical protein